MSITVTGAGCAAVNGIYEPNGQFKGKGSWKGPNGFELWYNGQWRIGKTNDYYYVLNKEEEHFVADDIWLPASFQANAAAVEPAPCVFFTSDSEALGKDKVVPHSNPLAASVGGRNSRGASCLGVAPV
jgi:hypothetical protein